MERWKVILVGREHEGRLTFWRGFWTLRSSQLCGLNSPWLSTSFWRSTRRES